MIETLIMIVVLAFVFYRWGREDERKKWEKEKK